MKKLTGSKPHLKSGTASRVSPQVPKDLKNKAKEVSQILKHLAHPVRLRILCQLCERPSTVNELQKISGLSQANTSQFLARLKTEGCIKAEREGRHVIYSLNNSQISELIHAVVSIFCQPKRSTS